MDLQEKITQLEAEKMSIDIMYADSIRSLHQTKTALILKEKVITDLNAQINNLMKELEDIKKEKDQLQNNLHVLGAEAQAI